jgi:nicotinate phosphoribosyltransferase
MGSRALTWAASGALTWGGGSARIFGTLAHSKRPFHTASDAEIKSGEVSDVYFARTVEILNRRRDRKRVMAEIYLKSLPEDWRWGILAGIQEAAALLEGLPVDVRAMDEGAVFEPYQPVVVIEGTYVEWAQYETALLGLLCQASGIATKAARCKKAAGDRQVISFGARRMHPTLAPMIERNAFIGGCDGVAVTKSAELIEADPMGTIPHSLVLMVGDTVEALRAFHESVDPKVRRVALIDTLQDEKFEAIRVAEALGRDLYAVRLDTPSSRRGDFFRILEEVRWELDLRGHRHVKLIASGGIDEYEILKLNPVADAYGVGTSIANAPVLNFALDIMQIEGRAIAKRGKWSGAKDVFRCRGCRTAVVVPAGKPPAACACGAREWEPLLKPLITGGRVARDLPPPRTIRDFVLEQLALVSLETLHRRGLRQDY